LKKEKDELVEALEKLTEATDDLIEHCGDHKYIDFDDTQIDGVQEITEAMQNARSILSTHKTQ
jgi:predicted mannosyl-3-phosphoglycerate phosphatase (HAD superfamily)